MKPELSRPWAQDMPKTAASALEDISELCEECTHEQRARREVAFAQARRFIEQARAGNGIGPTSESFPRKNRGQEPTARVDIEVKVGLAFTP